MTDQAPGGAMTLRIRPGFTVVDTPAAPVRPVSARLLDELARKPLSSSTLAFLIDAKELIVVQALEALAGLGKVIPGEIPATGRRDRLWSLAEAKPLQ